MITIDASKWAKRDMWRLPSGELAVRPGFRRVYTPENDDITGGQRVLVGGFTVQNPYVGDRMHYLFDVADVGNKRLRLLLLDENFDTFQEFALNVDAVPRAISFAVVQGQILIASPDFPTLWGEVGDAVIFATKQDSVSGLSAIDPPRGIVIAICNRMVVVNGSQIYVGEPIAANGGDVRSFVAQNQNQRPGTIYGAHEGADRGLVLVTSEGTYALDADSFAAGLVGSNGTGWRILSHHGARSFQRSCAVRGMIFALSQHGWLRVDQESEAEASLSDPMQPRAFGPRLALEDARECRMVATDVGPAVVTPDGRYLHRTDLARSISSWWSSPSDAWNATVDEALPTNLVGTLSDVDAGELLVTAAGVFRVCGNFDGDLLIADATEEQPRGVLAGLVDSAPSLNQLPRDIHVAAAVEGERKIYVAARGGGLDADAAPEPDPDGVTAGTTEWGADDVRWTTTPLHGVSFGFGARDMAPTRDLGLELAADGAGARVNDSIDVDFGKSATKRPEQRG